MSNPLVSVIAPSFRHEDYIEQAIRSVIEQTFVDWELIVIDDASSDASWQRIESFHDGRIRAFRHARNAGAPCTINEGLSLAQGRYVAILNSDDIFSPWRLERCVETMERENLDLLGTGLNLIDDKGVRISDSDHWWWAWYESLKALYRDSGDLLTTLFTGNIYITTSNFFFKRDLYSRIGGFADYRYVHDYDYLFRAIATDGVRVGFFEEENLLSYRLHGANTILENRMAASRETFTLLNYWHPRLLSGIERRRASAYSDQLTRVLSYIEEEYRELERAQRIRHEQLLQQSVQAYDENAAELEVARRTLETIQTECDALSQSYASIEVENRHLTERLAELRFACDQERLDRESVAAKYVETSELLASVTRELNLLSLSPSFRVGYKLLSPLRFLKRYFSKLSSRSFSRCATRSDEESK